MELVPYLITFAVGLVAGIYLEYHYGKQAAALNAQAHADLREIKAAVTKPEA